MKKIVVTCVCIVAVAGIAVGAVFGVKAYKEYKFEKDFVSFAEDCYNTIPFTYDNNDEIRFNSINTIEVSLSNIRKKVEEFKSSHSDIPNEYKQKINSISENINSLSDLIESNYNWYSGNTDYNIVSKYKDYSSVMFGMYDELEKEKYGIDEMTDEEYEEWYESEYKYRFSIRYQEGDFDTKLINFYQMLSDMKNQFI